MVLLTVALVSMILYLFDTTFTKKFLLKIFLDVEENGNLSYRIGPYLKNFLIILLPYAARLTCRSAAHHQPLSFLILAQVDPLTAKPSVELVMDPTTAGYGSLNSIWTPFKWVGEKAMAPHSSTLAWKIPWPEEPGGLQSMGLLRVGHD